MLMLKGRIIVADQEGTHVIKFLGDVRLTLCPALDQYLDNMFNSRYFKTILIDLTEAEGIDSTTLGMLAKMSIRMKKKMGFVPTLVSINDNITRVLLSMGFDKVFVFVNHLDKEILPNQTYFSSSKKNCICCFRCDKYIHYLLQVLYR